MNVPVTFTTTAINGLLEGDSWTGDNNANGIFDAGDATTSVTITTQTLTTLTNSSGEAEVEFFLSDGSSGGAQVVARISGTVGSPAVPYARNVTFGINGGGSSGGGGDDGEDDEDDEDDTTTGRTITVSPLTLTGTPSAVVQLGVLAGTTAVPVTVTGNAAFTDAGGLVTATGAIRDVRLPNTPGTTYSLTISATGYDTRTVPVTVTAAATGGETTTGDGTLSITLVGARVGTQQQVRVTVRDSANNLAVGTGL